MWSLSVVCKMICIQTTLCEKDKEEEEEEEELYFDPKSANVVCTMHHIIHIIYKIKAIYTHAHMWTHVH